MKKIYTLCLLLLIQSGWFPSNAQAESSASSRMEKMHWNVSDYFSNLPERYFTFFGDGPTADNLSSMYKIEDVQNGYIALLERKETKIPWFVMAIFRSSSHGTLVAVSNRHDDTVCSWYDTFILKKEGGEWIDVSKAVLPELSPALFYRSPQWPQFLADNPSTTQYSYHFKFPRKGTIVELTMNVCDFIEDAPPLQEQEAAELLHPDFSFRLKWSAQHGKFSFLK